MLEKIFYVKGSDVNDHPEINMALADGWIVKLVTPQNVHSSVAVGEIYRTEVKKIKGGFIIVLAKS